MRSISASAKLSRFWKRRCRTQPFTVFAGGLALEVDQRRPDAVDLPVSLGRVISHGNDQAQQIGAVLGKFGKNLDEAESPLTPLGAVVARVVLKAVKPCLKFVKDQGRMLLVEQVLKQGF